MYHKGLSGWVEYHPGTKTWSFKLKFTTINSTLGDTDTEAEAVLALKTAIDTLLSVEGAIIRSVD